MKSQEAAFKQARKPAKKTRETVEVKAASARGMKKNKSRNDRRKAARRTASLLKAGKSIPQKEDGDARKQNENSKGQEDSASDA